MTGLSERTQAQLEHDQYRKIARASRASRARAATTSSSPPPAPPTRIRMFALAELTSAVTKLAKPA
jgi:hypothetical protein